MAKQSNFFWRGFPPGKNSWSFNTERLRNAIIIPVLFFQDLIQRFACRSHRYLQFQNVSYSTFYSKEIDVMKPTLVFRIVYV